MRRTFHNDIKFILFAGIIGAVCSTVLWIFLLAVKGGTALLWDLLPGITGDFKWYPMIICLAGGILIGFIRRRYGDYPQDMMTVLGTVKNKGSYPYKNIKVLLIAALLPLIFGSSVGPEAGMVGIIAALCSWAGDNLKYAKRESAVYSEIGASVSLSLLFHAPLFGVFHMEEGENRDENGETLPKQTRVFIYTVATGAALGIFKLLNGTVCNVSSGFPSFETALPEGVDYAVMFLYIIAGILLGIFFEITERGFEAISKKIPPMSGEIAAGLVMGIAASIYPVVRFSGEHQMGVLIADYALYPAAGMIGLAVLKVFLANMCIRLGLKGGHFFPLMFAAVCLGYGISLMIWPGAESHAIFAAAITAAATLGHSMKKPIAVTMLLFLCFPIRMVFWILFAACMASYLSGWRPRSKMIRKSGN